jgi:hypothetical protein
MKYATYEADQGSKFMRERTISSVHKTHNLAAKAKGTSYGVVTVVDSAKKGDVINDVAI